MSEQHLPECQQVHCPDFYRDGLASAPTGGAMEAHIKRCIDESEGIYLLVCAEGCPQMEQARARGRELAKEHGW